MAISHRLWHLSGLVVLSLVIGMSPTAVVAHCDTLNGPVVSAAKKALAEGEVKWVLPWVRKEDEATVRHTFNQAVEFRDKGPKVQQLAETHFLETLVRLHRQAEGAPFTGLKPAGTDFGPAIPAADQALETEDIEPVVQLLTDAVENGIRAHFAEVMEKKKAYAPDDIEAGREYVDEYVTYIHYIEHLYETAQQPVAGHCPESQ